MSYVTGIPRGSTDDADLHRWTPSVRARVAGCPLAACVLRCSVWLLGLRQVHLALQIYTRHGELIAVTTQEGEVHDSTTWPDDANYLVGVIRPKQSTAPSKEATEVERARL